MKKREIVTKPEPQVSSLTFCNIKGLNNRIRFFLNKKFPNQIKTKIEWEMHLLEEEIDF